ncbi:hypothetical protein EMIT051CA3_30728 [Pseudomonas chlororaphis]
MHSHGAASCPYLGPIYRLRWLYLNPFPRVAESLGHAPLPARVAKDDAAFPIYRGALGSIANTCVPAKEVNAFRSITNFSPSPTTV